MELAVFVELGSPLLELLSPGIHFIADKYSLSRYKLKRTSTLKIFERLKDICHEVADTSYHRRGTFHLL